MITEKTRQGQVKIKRTADTGMNIVVLFFVGLLAAYVISGALQEDSEKKIIRNQPPETYTALETAEEYGFR